MNGTRILCVSLSLILWQCSTTNSSGTRGSGDQAAGARIKGRTDLPPRFHGVAQARKSSVILPPATTTVSVITRNSVEVREGPRSSFMLKDFLLEKGTPVLVFDKIGVWTKILTVGTWQQGWVHEKALSTPHENENDISAEVQKLPVVITVRPIDRIFSYPVLSPLAVQIPRGTVFVVLKKSNRRSLVWLAETNSLAWLANGDVQ